VFRCLSVIESSAKIRRKGAFSAKKRGFFATFEHKLQLF